jgi:leucyl-tRNA synthetase
MEYNFLEIEQKWQKTWQDKGAYKVFNNSPKPKYYVLDMFPYPSGAGLHVGHPLGYIASDIFSRYKRLKGFNVLHPMGYDAFGLPAEQYAIEHGIHPAISTKKNIETFRGQLDKMGFCYDWDREVRTSEPGYYKWTQWIFLQLFNSFFNRQKQKAEPISELIISFEKFGNEEHPFPNEKFVIQSNVKSETSNGNESGVKNFTSPLSRFTSDDWKSFDEPTRQSILMEYRLAYCGYGEVNWCEALGTVLANDEVVNGVSERGGHPVVKKKLRQWYLRITEYADRLLQGLETIDFSDAMKEMQTNWIGKSFGAEIDFPLTPASPRGGEGPGLRLGTAAITNHGANPLDYENAKRMRKEPTEAESILWNAIRNRQIEYKFRRQHPVAGFIADFACLEVWLLVEVDGGYHTTEEQNQYDKERNEYLKDLGYTTIRFTNDEVKNDLQNVLLKIKNTAEELKIQNQNQGTNADGSSPLGEAGVRVYTTRPDTIFGVDFMVLAPEHELVQKITTAEQRPAIDTYLEYVNSRSERERQAEKKISGCFTGAYAINPFDGREIPIWISEYVLAGYGTGAIMAVPCGDERDHKFAQHFGIGITNIIGDAYNGEEANPTKDAILQNSGFINGMVMRDAMEVVINKLEELGIGKRKVNYKMRDAAFSRQRYWGEPFPIQWKEGVANAMDESELPLTLPEVENYAPGPEGEGPLANIPEWVARELETNTMPGYAGSSWYFLRYMDPRNNKEFCSRQASDYWNQVDLYVGGTEHAVGHLLYSRMWTKALYDLGHIGFDEPFKKLLNQGMIQGSSRFVYRVGSFKLQWIEDASYPEIESDLLLQIASSYNFYVSKKYYEAFEKSSNADSIINWMIKEISKEYKKYPFTIKISGIIQSHVDVNIVDGYELQLEKFIEKRKALGENPIFLLEDGSSPSGGGREGAYLCGSEVEKMSKSKFNTVNPDDLVAKYGADTFRMYEMFLGPVEVSKPWDTKGIEGVHRFLKKLWRLFYDDVKGFIVTNDAPAAAELKVLHKTIKKIEEDTERYSFNTAVSAFMIAVNELSDLKCHKREILEPLLVLLTPYAPHISEELWHAVGNASSVLDAAFPRFEAKHVAESSKEYPVSINGKVRTNLQLPLDAMQNEVQEAVLANEVVQKWMEGKPMKKFIFVKGKMINVVV